MTKYTIYRSKLYPVPGTNYRFAWKWLYRIERSGTTIANGIDRLDSTMRFVRSNARAQGGAYYVEKAWEMEEG